MLKIAICLALMVVSSVCGDFHVKFRSISTSISTMEELLNVEKSAIDTLEKIAEALKQKADLVNFAVKVLRAKNSRGSEDPERFLSNPINAYSLIRRTHEDWMRWILYLEQPAGQEEIENLKKLRTEMPTMADMNEASSAIHRLALFYDLKPQDMANGTLNGIQYDTAMSSMDAYAMGYHFFVQDNYTNALPWLNISVQKYQPFVFDQVMNFSLAKLQVLHAEVLIKNGMLHRALRSMDAVLEKQPHNLPLQLKRNEIEFILKTQGENPIVATSVPKYWDFVGCRDQYTKRISNLHCFYGLNATAFVKIAPIKMELLSLDPYMVLYHDVISDKEIDVIKKMSKGNLRRATVYNVNASAGEILNTRTGQFVWFEDNTNNVIKRINRRIKDMTGLSLEDAEQLQAMNYGVGGHYDLHSDYFQNDKLETLPENRKATVLFYMSDVEQGGATVFPMIETVIFPKKGSAVMWYNLDKTGAGNEKSLHLACPVLVGSKWIINKWISTKGQIFTDPCLKQQK